MHLAIGEETVLQILDDGIGYEPDSVPGFVLSNMKRRAEALGGEYTIGRRSNGGTIVRWVVPTNDELSAGSGPAS